MPQELVTKSTRRPSGCREDGAVAEESSWIPDPRWPRTRRQTLSIGTRSGCGSASGCVDGVVVAVAYNEVGAPTLEESVEELIKKGATHITVTTTMFTPGGSHSEVEIPEILDHLRPRHPGVELRYAWPFDLQLVAKTLAEQVKRFS